MKNTAIEGHYYLAQPENIPQQIVTTSISNTLTGDTLLSIQLMFMSPAVLFFSICLMVHLYRKYVFRQKLCQLQRITNLERILQSEINQSS